MTVNGWRLYAHPLFERQLRALTEKARAQGSLGERNAKAGPAVKLLRTVEKHIREIIPADPGGSQFRQGNTLGKENRQWFRAKFHTRYRLFFRFATTEKAIVYVWLNDESTLRKSGSKTAPYAIFEAMLTTGDPPKSLEELLASSQAL